MRFINKDYLFEALPDLDRKPMKVSAQLKEIVDFAELLQDPLSMQAIRFKTGLSKRQVHRNFRYLEDLGFKVYRSVNCVPQRLYKLVEVDSSLVTLCSRIINLKKV
jgi:biotin operon repressor